MSEFRSGAARRHRFVSGLISLALLCACSDADQPSDNAARSELASGVTAASRAEALPRFDSLIERAGPAVVSIAAVRSLDDEADLPAPELDEHLFADLYRHLLPQRPEGAPRPSRALGSGFVISPDGYILTSAHVVAGSDTVIVSLPDRKRELPASVLGIDRRTDVALLKVDARDLPVVVLGTSTHLRAGDWVVAIGSPFGLSNTITAGIVGATQRTLPDESLVPFIQTDVAVNPGNSGGPLLNLAGEVVGINAIIYSRTGGYMGISFAVPIELALEVSEQLRAQGHVTRGTIGVHIQALTEKLARPFGTSSTHGVLVAAVEPGGAAAQAGLQPGDVILEYGGVPIESVEHALRVVASSKPGTQTAMQVWRNGKLRDISVTVGELPAEKLVLGPSPGGSSTATELRLVVTELPLPQRRALRVDYGLVVESVQGTAAEELQPGDIIVALNQMPLTTRRQFDELLAAQDPGNTVALRVIRDLSAMYVPMRIPGEITPLP